MRGRAFPDINNNFSKSESVTDTVSLEQSSSYFSDQIRLVDQWKRQVLPHINQSNPVLLINNSFGNISQSKKSKTKKSFDDSDEEVPQSKLYFRNVLHDNQISLLRFEAVNVIVQPIYIKPRIFEEKDTDKSAQPASHPIFRNMTHFKSIRPFILHKSFVIDKKNDRLSMMSSKKPFMLPPKRAPEPLKTKRSISYKKSSMERSIVYLRNKEIKLELFPGIVDIKQMKPVDYHSQVANQKLLENLGMESTDSKINTATFVAKHKADVLKVTFSMIKIIFEMVNEKVSEGIQVDDENAYFQGYSEITDRSVYISVPKTTYQYEDPFVKIKLKNMAIRLKKQEPRWVYDTRMERIRFYNRCRVMKPSNNSREIRKGSLVCFEGNNFIHKAKTGTVPFNVEEDEYEKWMIALQKIDYPNSNMGTRGTKQFDANFAGAISDCDLVMYSI